MITVKLQRKAWRVDPDKRLGGRGGFGEVFEGHSIDGEAVAIKRLYVEADAAAHRELRIAEQLVAATFEHVLPVLDSGKDADSDRYYVVMPRADRSLQDELDRRERVPEAEAISILLDVAAGLAELPDIVHRDLKPANILRHEDVWKIADFGIARFVEESTSLQTLRECLSPQYGAPEQWRGERTTRAADVYALGCIAHALVIGRPPFDGEAVSDYKLAHLVSEPPPLAAVDPRLRGLVSAMLRKAPDTRPSLKRVVDVLRSVLQRPVADTPGASDLQEANAAAAARRSEREAKAVRARQRDEQRKSLADAGWAAFDEVLSELERAIREQASEATVSRTGRTLKASLGTAVLDVGVATDVIPEGSMPNSGWDAVVRATIGVAQKGDRPWSHGATLWFMRVPSGGEFRWHEVSYKQHGLYRGPLQGPFAQTDVNDADLAAGPGMHMTVIESGPMAIDDEHVTDFVDRWLGRLARAFSGRLQPF
jgi:eukaryotic-like serine/threonine-protein kinase